MARPPDCYRCHNRPPYIRRGPGGYHLAACPQHHADAAATLARVLQILTDPQVPSTSAQMRGYPNRDGPG